MTGIRIRAAAIAAVLALGVGVFTGCTGEPPTEPVPPGVEAGSLGGMEVVGYLAQEGGAWTVFDADPNAPEGSEPEVLATLVPGSVDEGGIEALDGRYIWAAGRSSDDEADAPEIKVDGIDVAMEEPE